MEKPKLIIVNNNMKIGGVQKSLYNLLWSIAGEYDITLLLFSRIGAYAHDLPDSIRFIEIKSWFRLLGVSQQECRGLDRIIRGVLVTFTRIFGRHNVLKLVLATQKIVPGDYDCAVAFLQNGSPKNFYGGVQEFVRYRIRAKKKVAFLHCDYSQCGADHPSNNALLSCFDTIALCSEGCKKVFEKAVPELGDKSMVVRNCHRIQQIKSMANENPIVYSNQMINVLVVARLAHEKGVERAVLAVIYAVSLGLPVVLHIVGDGPMLVQLENLVEEHQANEYVLFYGEQENPYRYMLHADLFLLTSYHEAAPMVLEEAGMLGLPVLTVRTISSHEMVLNRKIGWVCDNDQSALNTALVEVLLNGKFKNMRTELMGRNYDNAAALAQFTKLFEDLYENYDV